MRWSSSSGSGSRTSTRSRATSSDSGSTAEHELTGDLLVALEPHELDELEAGRGARAPLRARGRRARRRADASAGQLTALPRGAVGAPARRWCTRHARRRPGAPPRCGPACASASTARSPTCATPTGVSVSTEGGVVRRAGAARDERLSPAGARDPPVRRAGLRLRAGERAARPTSARVDRLARRQGLGDMGNQFHYYRLTADDRILWGGYDAVYRYGGPVGPALDDDEPTFATLVPALLHDVPAARGAALHAPLGRRDRHVQPLLGVLRHVARRARRLRRRLHRPRRRREPLRRARRARPARRPRHRGDRAGATCADGRCRSRPSRCARAAIELTRNRLAAADRNGGRRGLWLRRSTASGSASTADSQYPRDPAGRA